jgi:MFS family permease
MRLSRTAAFYLLASIILFFLAGSSAPTPLYGVYQAAWGFTPITITVVFGIYAVAVLITLLVVGSLSDYIGRRPVLIAATLLQAVAMLVFATAHGVSALLAARVIQGVATGAAAGAVGAGMLDIDRARGTIANSVGPMLGTATGGLLAGVMVQYLPAPTQLVYVVLGVIFIAQAIGVALMPESVIRRPGALASLRPQFRLPPQVRHAMLTAAPVLIASWALGGFYGALGPTLVRRIANSSSLVLGGVLIFVLAGSGALTVLALRNRSPRTVTSLGAGALVVGVPVTLLAITTSSVPVFFVGAILAGAGFGAGFQGAIRTVVPLAAPSERAGVLSILYIIAYLAMGVPAVLGGIRAVHGGGMFTTAREYGIAVMALAALALIGTVLRRPSEASAAPALARSLPPRR